MKKETTYRVPETFSKFPEEIMSNFDREINEEVRTSIKNKQLYADYPAWNFHARVWYEKVRWRCEIWRFGSYIETISSKTLRGIMNKSSKKYGYN